MCLVPKYGIEVPIYFTASNQPGGYKLSEDGMSISGGAGGGHTVRMLDKLRVEVRSLFGIWIRVDSHGPVT